MLKGKVKNFVSAILCIAMLIGLLPLNLYAAEPSSTAVLYTEGIFHEAQTRDVLKLVNAERAKVGAKPLVMTVIQEEIAEQRAVELIALFKHVRPDGSDCFSILEEAELGCSGVGENIAAGQRNAAEVMTSWMDSKGHRENILNPDFTHIGIGCFEYYGIKFWVQFFTTDPDDTEAAVATGEDNLEFGVAYAIDPNVVVGCSMEFLEPEIELELGDSAEFDLCCFDSDGYFLGVVLSPFLDVGNMTIAKGLVTVDEEGYINAVKKGTPGTEKITVNIGNLTATKTIQVFCSHKEENRTIDRKEATCTEEGYEKEVCGSCGEVLSNKVLAKSAHKMGEWKVTTAPGCTTKGTEKKSCTVCGKEETREVAALGHSEEVSVVKEPTCTESGVKETKCKRCQEVLATETIKALGHNWGAWEEIQAPTWDEDGLESRKCTRCNMTEENVIPKLSNSHTHDFSGAETVVKAPTCTEEGTKEIACTNENCDAKKTVSIAPLGHKNSGKWETVKEPTCAQEGKSVQKCTVCGEVLEEKVLAKTEHVWDNGKVTKEATCTENGIKKYTCTVCGNTREEAISALGHDGHEVITEATCTKDGKKEIICSRCKEVLSTEKISALGHNWSEWSVVTDATWDEEGLQERTCSRCNEVEEKVIPKLSETHEHDFTGKETVVKEPTCTEEGSKEIECSNPYCDVVKTEKIEARGHEREEIITEATCTEAGLRKVVCKRCDKVLETEEIAALGHDWSEWNIVTNPTWNEEGLQKRICSRCDKVEEQVIPKESETHEHDFTGEEVVLKEATCTEAGSKEVTCSNPNCGEKIIVTIEALGHTHGEWETVTEATCTEEGKAIMKCTVCGEVIGEKVLKVLPHNYGEWEVTKKPSTSEEGERQCICEDCGYVLKETIDKIKVPETGGKKPSDSQASSIKTGDKSPVAVWVISMAAVVLIGGAVVVSKKRRR